MLAWEFEGKFPWEGEQSSPYDRFLQENPSSTLRASPVNQKMEPTCTHKI